MAVLCTCDDAYGNTGSTGCELIAGSAYSVILQPMYNEDGERNFIDLSTPATIGTLLRTMTSAATSPMSRLYPLPVAENVTQEKTATQFVTAPSNRKYRAQEGVRTILLQFMGENSSFRFLGELQKFGCSALQYFIVDSNGNIVGASTEEDKLFGIPVASSSYDLMLQFALDATVQTITMQFDVEYGFDDATLKILTVSTIGYPATTLRGIVTATGTVIGTPTTTTAVVQISYATNNAVGQTKGLTGLVSADFDLNELEPTPGVIAVTASESLVTPGLYTLTYATQTSGDILEGTATRANFEVIPFIIEIP